MKFFCCFVIAAGFVTCSESVKLREKASTVEFVSQQYIGEHGSNCKQLTEYDVEAIPAEISAEDRLSVLEVKAKNQALQHEATHLLLWPSEEWPCKKDGTPDPDNDRTCARQSVTAYSCIIGRGT